MLTIAHTATVPATLDKLRAALPDVRLFQTSLEAVRGLVTDDLPDCLLVDGSALAGRDSAQLAVIKAQHPWLMMIALVPFKAELLRRAFDLGYHGVVDHALIIGAEDHPAQIRTTFAQARIHTVAATIMYACSPLPAVLARPHLDEVLGNIADLREPRQFAAALGTSLPQLREQFFGSRLFPPKALLGRFRLLVAARMLQDSNESVEKVGLSLYASPTAFRNAFREELGVTPSEVRQRGGLRFAGQLLRVALQAWRAKIA